jgi:hypothetical protein
MKLPTFKRDTAGARRQVLEQTAQAASQLAQLRTERQAALLDSDLETIEKHDAGIAAQERRIATLQEKLRLLTEEQKRERNEEREQARETAVKIIEKKLAGRETLAQKLEAAIKDAGDAYFELTSYPSPLISDWHFPLPRAYRQIDINGINREVSLALYSASRPIEGKPRMPSASSLDSGVAGIKSETISGVVARQNRDLVQLLRVMSLGRDDEPEENAA